MNLVVGTMVTLECAMLIMNNSGSLVQGLEAPRLQMSLLQRLYVTTCPGVGRVFIGKYSLISLRGMPILTMLYKEPTR